ncbi:MAG: altronate dehydratase [Clostridia bacterium]|nr:altronate dehydratase [Clostridia bacterium]
MMQDYLQLHPLDNVGVLFQKREDIPAGHKIALTDIPKGEKIIKYGNPIGRAACDIRAGEWVHSHNLKTALGGEMEYEYTPAVPYTAKPFEGSFMGYLRKDGKAGIRNEIWVLPLVGCVNRTATRIAEKANQTGGSPVYAFTHPYGCSQLGEDHDRTKQLLLALCRHPNAGGVLVLGLGCENNTMQAFREALGEVDEERIRFLVCQDVEDEEAAALQLIDEMKAVTARDERVALPVSKLVIGLKCGGSDGFSGITANPLLGVISDRLCAAGGTALLTEVPEMFGAEHLLMARCRDEQVFKMTCDLVNGFKAYYEKNGMPVYENPSPGNKAGGITTLEEKSLGCTQKGGLATVEHVLDYATPEAKPGLNLVWGPGNDICAVTALTAAGAQLILFTTGRGTPLGGPAPTMKVATNTALSEKKKGWIDFNAGILLSGTDMQTAGEMLFSRIIAIANGEETTAEQKGYREIAIFKSGVTL